MNKKQYRQQIADEVFAAIIDPELAKLIEDVDIDDIDIIDTTKIKPRRSKRKQAHKEEVAELASGNIFKKLCEKQRKEITKLKNR